MRKKLGTVNIHSNIDLITNSSTEIFCQVEGKDQEAVEEVLYAILEDFGCSCLTGGEYGLEVREHEEWDDEKSDFVVKEGVFDISYEQGFKPCKMISKKLEEMLNIIPESEE